MNPRDLFEHVWTQKAIRFGDLAVAHRKITPDQLDRALASQKGDEAFRPLAQVLIEQGALTTAECAELLLEQEELTDGAEHRRVGRFLLLYPIGRGGMGVVWKGWDTQLGRAVALKMLHVDDERERPLLLREARTAAQLSHPNIISVYEVIEHQGSPCIAMELIEGGTLDAAVAGQPLRRALELTRDAARAVAYAHGKGVVHRDLKPQNLMVDRAGKIVVMDFGLAKHAESPPGASHRTTVAGTPAFMAPEQALGRHEQVGPRSDVYSLGATLYSLIAGRAPFEGAGPAEILVRVVSQDPVPLRKIRPGLHRDIETIVQKAMDKDPARRYASADALAVDLERYLGGEEILARPVSTLTKAARRLRRHRTVLVMTLMVVAAAGWAYFLWRAETARRRARPHLEEARAALAEADRQLIRPVAGTERFWNSLKRAKEAIARALAEDPSFPEAYFVRAQTRQLEGDLAGADADYTRALELDRNYAPCRVRRALNRLAQRMIPIEMMGLAELENAPPIEAEDVAQELERAIASGSEVPEQDLAYARLAMLVARKDYDAALRLADETLPRLETEDLLRLRAYILHRRGRIPEARKDLERALQLKHYDVQSRLAMAQLLFHDEDWKSALRNVEIAASILPRRHDVLTLRGYVRFKLSEPEKALADLTLALETAPDSAPVLIQKATVLYSLDRLEESLDCLTRARTSPPLEAQARMNRAVVLEKLARFEEAVAEFDAAERLDPKMPLLYFNRGLMFLRRKRIKEARAQFERAVELGRRHVGSWSNLAKCCWEEGDLEAAIRAYARVVELAPADAWGRYGRALCLMKQERWKDAEEDLEKAVELAPAEAEFRASRALTRRSLQNAEGAFQDADDAVRINPECANAYLERSCLRFFRHELSEMEADADRAADLFRRKNNDVQVSKAIFNRGVARHYLQRESEGMADVEESIRLDPTNAMAYYFVAERLEAQDSRGAEAKYAEAAKHKPNWAEAWYGRGKMLIRLDDLPGAETCLVKAVEIRENYPTAWTRLGIAREGQKKYNDALAAYSKALQLDANQTTARANRGVLLASRKRYSEAIPDLERAIREKPQLQQMLQPILDDARRRSNP